jgi:thiamine-phosphate pyrophosphorylase
MEIKPCGLISVIPPALQQEWAANVAGLAGRFRPAALIFEDPAPALLAQAIAGARGLELAVLAAAADAESAAAAKAGGVYLNIADAQVGRARTLLGSAAIIGAACGLSRHAAMESAEAGADFVAFDASSPESLEQAVELAAWWDEITGVPVALDFGRELPDKSVLEEARPDFLMIREANSAGESLTFATEFGLRSQV